MKPSTKGGSGKVEWDAGSLSLGDGLVGEGTDAGAEHVELVAVLVHWVGCCEGAFDLDDQVDPLIVVGLENEV